MQEDILKVDVDDNVLDAVQSTIDIKKNENVVPEETFQGLYDYVINELNLSVKKDMVFKNEVEKNEEGLFKVLDLNGNVFVNVEISRKDGKENIVLDLDFEDIFIVEDNFEDGTAGIVKVLM